MKHQQISKTESQKHMFMKEGKSIYKQTLLEMLHARGWLRHDESKYNEDERLHYGLLFISDYFKTFKYNVHSSFCLSGKIDGVRFMDREMFQDAVKRYRRAIRNIPAEFWPIIKSICIEEKEPIPPKYFSDRQKTYKFFSCILLPKILNIRVIS